MLVSAMLFYYKLTKALLSYGFDLNPYNPCVVNKMVNGEQLTVCWHVDDLKSSHIDPKVNEKFLQWSIETFGQLGEVKMTWTCCMTILAWHLITQRQDKSLSA